MTDDEELRKGGDSMRKAVRADESRAEIERRIEELEVFRDAGVLTDAELEEQKARLRWHLP
jgi:hypothetical protein